MRATFQNLFHSLDIAAFLRTRQDHAISVVRWVLILLPMAFAVGSLCAVFLWSLDVATQNRFEYPWLLFLLPVGGFGIALLYQLTGRGVEAGNNLIVEQIHEPGGGVPLRMAPLIFVGTVATHLFGGSAGREGTAVQLGGSLASAIAKLTKLDSSGTRILLMGGVAAGFGAVFGTPLAGAIFALEVLAIGRIEYTALVPCLLAGLVGDWTCHFWGIHHGVYHIDYKISTGGALIADPLLMTKAAIAGVLFGLTGLFFAEANHALGFFFKSAIRYAPLRPVVGGLLVIALVYICGTRDYLGLGVWSSDPHAVTVVSFFSSPVDRWSWLLKIIFTVVTLSAGFKGGEVTPLFFIGAALGNTLGWLLGAPIGLFAGLGFVAVFAGAANTPLACTIMGVELFGATHVVPISIACSLSYLCSGHSGIYLSQRIAVPKARGANLPPGSTLRDARPIRPKSDLAEIFQLPTTTIQECRPMPRNHQIKPSEIGMIRIYIKPSDRIPKAKARNFWSDKSLYRELVAQAKSQGIMHAVAHHTHFGFSSHGQVRAAGMELSDPQLTMCVELIDQREALEKFCVNHGALLENKVIVYKHLEHWTIAAKGIDYADALPEEHSISED